VFSACFVFDEIVGFVCTVFVFPLLHEDVLSCHK
jgi:hypothetical protein